MLAHSRLRRSRSDVKSACPRAGEEGEDRTSGVDERLVPSPLSSSRRMSSLFTTGLKCLTWGWGGGVNAVLSAARAPVSFGSSAMAFSGFRQNGIYDLATQSPCGRKPQHGKLQ